jgi:general secretion pathway protein E
VVLRLVRGSRAIPDVESLAFSSEVHDGLVDLVSRPQGLLFVTGPVGSGKTTTLYAALKQISKARGRTTTMVTLEDPIELELPFATQTQMHPKAGMTFAGTLRSVLRQDPNVLMVGEIRDRETAEIAMQAGLTGHLILTTVHGQSAAGPFARLVEMGIEPFILASATVGCLSQRLVRTLCTACRREAKPDPIVVDRFAQAGVVLPQATYYEHVGCDFCEGQGFTGRLPIAELLILNEALRAAVNGRKPSSELHQLAVAEGMTPLLRDGLLRAQRGETSLMEVLRVAG